MCVSLACLEHTRKKRCLSKTKNKDEMWNWVTYHYIIVAVCWHFSFSCNLLSWNWYFSFQRIKSFLFAVGNNDGILNKRNKWIVFSFNLKSFNIQKQYVFLDSFHINTKKKWLIKPISWDFLFNVKFLIKIEFDDIGLLRYDY